MLSVWAHRGESGAYPENTLSAFSAALRYDIAGIEMDVQRTADGQLVVIHDETVDRTTDGTGAVQDMTLAELKALSIRAPGGRRETVPTLQEVLDLLRAPCLSRGLRLNLELKNSKVPYEGMEEQLLRAVEQAGLQDHVIFSTFSRASVRRLKALKLEAEVGMLCQSASECLAAAEQTGADALHVLLHWQDVEALRQKTALPVRGWNYDKFEPFWPEERKPELFSAEDAERLGFTDIITNFPGAYVPELPGDRGRALAAGAVQMLSGKSVSPETGLLVNEQVCREAGAASSGSRPHSSDTRAPGSPTAVNYEPFRVEPGDVFRVKEPGAACRLWAYSPEIPADLIYTYSYQEESNWTTFRGLLAENVTEFLFAEPLFVRAEFPGGPQAAEKTAEADAPLETVSPQETDAAAGLRRGRDFFTLTPSVTERFPGEKTAALPAVFQAETRRIAALLQERRMPGDTVLFLLSDTHYTVNGIWENTLRCLKRTAEQCRPDAVIHLGDLTDGLLPREILKTYVQRVMQGLSGLPGKKLLCVGNHDRNYFRQNPDVLTEAESAALYRGLGGEGGSGESDRGDRGNREYYFEDLPGKQLRLIVLASFDPGRSRNRRYGYTAEELLWLGRTLAKTPKEFGVLVLSHLPLLPEMHVFSRGIRGSRMLRIILRGFHRSTGRLLAFVHGHIHADQVTHQEGFPVVAVGCGKLESFPEYKPAGAAAPARKQGELSQELWDIVRISGDRRTVEFLRYGAGSSRTLRTGAGTESNA